MLTRSKEDVPKRTIFSTQIIKLKGSDHAESRCCPHKRLSEANPKAKRRSNGDDSL